MRGVIVAWCLRPCYSVSRKNCYLVSAGDLHNRYSHLEDTSKRMTPGLLIGCHVDTSTGLLSFTVNGREAANKFQVSSSSSSLLSSSSSSSSSPSSSSSSLSVTVRHRPSSSVTVRHRPSSSVTVRHRPSPSVTVRHRPLSSVTVRHHPSPSVTVRHRPSPSVTVRHSPSSSVTVRHRPSPSVVLRRPPSPSVTVRHRPSPSVILPHPPSSSVTVRHRPSPSVTVRHPPSSSVAVRRRPSPSRHPPSPSVILFQETILDRCYYQFDVSATFSQVEPGAMLFPAVFFEPTNKEILQLELGRTKVSDPISPLEHYLPTWQHLFGFIPFKKKKLFFTHFPEQPGFTTQCRVYYVKGGASGHIISWFTYHAWWTFFSVSASQLM